MRTRQKCVATDTWRSLGCRTTPLEHWSRRKPTVEPRWAKQLNICRHRCTDGQARTNMPPQLLSSLGHKNSIKTYKALSWNDLWDKSLLKGMRHELVQSQKMASPHVKQERMYMYVLAVWCLCICFSHIWEQNWYQQANGDKLLPSHFKSTLERGVATSATGTAVAAPIYVVEHAIPVFSKFLTFFPNLRILLAHLSRRLTRWAYRMGLEPASVRVCVHPCVHTFKHEYLRDQQADYNQILSEASLGWGKGCIRFWCRSDQNSGFHGNG